MLVLGPGRKADIVLLSARTAGQACSLANEAMIFPTALADGPSLELALPRPVGVCGQQSTLIYLSNRRDGGALGIGRKVLGKLATAR